MDNWKVQVFAHEAELPFLTGHGMPMSGEPLFHGLAKLVDAFEQIAIPDYGKYVDGRKH